jgi:hypothetical protein
MEPNQKVSLGHGSLILIALVILILGSIGARGLDESIDELGAKLQMLDQRCQNFEVLLSRQRGEIEELQGLIEALRRDLRQAGTLQPTSRRDSPSEAR